MRPFLLAILGSLVLAGSAYAVASDLELEDLAAEFRADEVAFEEVRAELDEEVRRYTRPLFNALVDSIVAQPTLEDARAQAERVRLVLAAPGPAPSVSKHLHEVTRQAGAEGVQALRRHIAAVEGLIGE